MGQRMTPLEMTNIWGRGNGFDQCSAYIHTYSKLIRNSNGYFSTTFSDSTNKTLQVTASHVKILTQQIYYCKNSVDGKHLFRSPAQDIREQRLWAGPALREPAVSIVLLRQGLWKLDILAGHQLMPQLNGSPNPLPWDSFYCKCIIFCLLSDDAYYSEPWTRIS